jgi:MFS family permease
MYQELMVGLRYVLTDQVMRGVLISFLALFLGLGAANVTFVPLLIDELHMKEEGLGLIRLTQSLGIILGSAATTAIAARYKARNIIGISMLLFGITTFIVAITPNYALMVLVLFAVGIAIAPPQIVAPTLMQRHVPSERLGRASSAQGTIVTVANILSMGAAGYLMDHIGAREIFMASGILIFSAGLVSRWVLRGVEDVPEEVAVSN